MRYNARRKRLRIKRLPLPHPIVFVLNNPRRKRLRIKRFSPRDTTPFVRDDARRERLRVQRDCTGNLLAVGWVTRWSMQRGVVYLQDDWDEEQSD
jgi:hypothetical protein